MKLSPWFERNRTPKGGRQEQIAGIQMTLKIKSLIKFFRGLFRKS